MRRIAAQVEALDPVSFVLLIGLVAGTIQGMPRVFLGGVTGAPPRLIAFLVIGIAAIVWWTAALLLWWVVVRRRSSLWMAAAQVTLGLAIAETFAAALGVVGMPLAPHSTPAAGFIQQLLIVVYSGFIFTLYRSPLWFCGAALAIGLGRHLAPGQAAAPASTHPGAVT
jgi:hypothetical protein